MAYIIIWLIAFFGAAIAAQVLWARMVRTLREHHVSYSVSPYNLEALRAYHRFVRRPLVTVEEEKLLRWVYVTMALTWGAFLGLLASLAAYSSH